jgi:imidazolonepropionase-like amidohydrolase
MSRRTVVLDATVVVLEQLFTSWRGEIADYARPYTAQLPPQLIREAKMGGLAHTEEERLTFKKSYARALEILGRLHQGGVQIVPGTDGLAGLQLARELEIYVAAGIDPLDVLQMATLGPARMMKLDKDLGSVTVGKLADLILVDGDPSRDIGAIRNLDVVVKGGVFYDPRKIDEAVGIAPRPSP